MDVRLEFLIYAQTASRFHKLVWLSDNLLLNVLMRIVPAEGISLTFLIVQCELINYSSNGKVNKYMYYLGVTLPRWFVGMHKPLQLNVIGQIFLLTDNSIRDKGGLFRAEPNDYNLSQKYLCTVIALAKAGGAMTESVFEMTCSKDA